MCHRTSVSWTAMIGGFAQKGDLDEALSLFNEMETTNEKPDEVTVVALLSACSHAGDLEVGRWINRYVMEKGFGKNMMILNALIDMYAKCGSVHDAQIVFDSMRARTVVSWTTLIAGYALNGKSEEALNLFLKMLNLGLEPNHLTYLAVLQACVHAGLLEKGWEFFDLMKKVHLLKPRIEHYACMADLLGRGGKVIEALEFVLNIPMKPDAGIWGSLLSACGIHKNVEVGEYAVDQLSKLDPFNAVPYVAMANLYAAERKWASMARIRSTMKDKGVKKLPGQSVVRVDGKVHVFTVEDRFHLEGLPIFELLDGLTMQLKNQGVDQVWIQ
ncbi:pentatricopeptide repeat-containing protein At4g19191, mitochondrial-like [Aristolochia californica]|uniref:pentatricopeptide repeat-containing protein At4g19191, mitochondrial-like n=1 Tax=Aristolochia californica TaxID=171875 RepID=UPI0035DC7982